MTIKSDVRRIAKLCGDDTARPTLPALPGGRIPVHGGYALGLRWTTDKYTRLRNAAWLVRNTRSRSESNPIALLVVLQEAEALVKDGEPLIDILEAFAELLRAS